MVREEVLLQGMIDSLNEYGKWYGMDVNTEKRKLMRILNNRPKYRL